MFWRALLAFLALPGMVAYAIPLVVVRGALGRWPPNPWGLVLVVAGSALLLACVREFYVAGRGTLAPWSPPTRLVISGPYRRTRNPMYLAVLAVLSGWAVLFGSTTLAIYAACVAVAFELRVILFEEPWAARTFGGDWQEYRSRVPRWLL